ncbi:MAG: DUF3987 domain-containing protein [Planctomycetia bacterium]|nr:DUF3987 domain-containing protein [Planctomycetia bacterium]
MDRQQSPLLVVCDELNQWINSFTRYNNNSAINGWLSLHKLGPQIVTRADDSKNYNIPRAAASVFGTIQTDRFVEAMANDEFINSGFLARCLFTFAESGWQPFRKKSPHPIEGPAENYNQIVRNLHALPHPKSKEKPHTSTMTQEADEVWARWYNGTMNELRKESEQWPERSKQRCAWNSGLEKIEELPARLAIVLHAVDCIGTDQNAGDLNTPVSPETMANAIEIATWFVQGLRTVCRMIADQPANNRPTYRPQTPEEYVLSKFHQEAKERLEIRDILRKCRRYDAVDQLKPVLDSLVQNASLIVEPGETKSGKTTKFYRLP